MIETRRPKLELLSREFVERIIDEGLTLLERHGVLVENAEALDLLTAAGARVDPSTGMARIGRPIIEAALATAPPSVTVYDRSGGRAFTVGGDEVHFDPGSAGVTLLDHDTRTQRQASAADLAAFYKLTETLEHLHFQSTCLVPADVPSRVADAYRLWLGLVLSEKPFVTGTFRVEGFRPMKDLLAAVRGGESGLRARPLAIFDACPSPPLKWSNLTAQSLVDAARAGVPSELISMGMTGATSPTTIAGTLVQHVAESLSGVAIVQLAAAGAPVIFGGSPSSFDMRHGTTPMGAMETMMIDVGYAQIGKALKLPTHAYMALSDAKVNDAQAGFETGLGAVLAALAGINVVSGPGMLDFESCMSLEKLVIDDGLCAMAYRLIEGVAQRDDPIALGVFDGFRPGQSFLTHPHTRRWYRTEHLPAGLADRDPYEAWAAAGGTTIVDKAHDDVARRLGRYSAPPLAGDLRRDLDGIMSAYARSSGVPAPALPAA
ncbi:MAG TPA: trimethylamine methyltransferase family protein [Candidatus Aminicenantes bacterium]|nr:trimethylamine methyltransferase family protein [Candidatus Aminicenantes bacterium]HRY65182.1 trimethylamine methyltransferase family protein [Candidatus Aminicenantes bacterium]HRZ72350.1 trimethylamine methyltransferase family protein [Candidatus Aminicenantes bacterium]